MSAATMTKQETKAQGEALTIEVRDDGVAIVRMDIPGEPVNTLKADFEAQFARTFEALDRDPRVRAVVFASGKADSFIAGADIKMLEGARTADEAAALSRKGQAALDRLAAFRAPVVAAIHGPCLGGGLEVALACAGRVASDDKKTKLGLPEVQLGLLPGAGGTQRLPRLIGVQAALDLMLTGRQLDGKRAQKLGLVDEVCPAAVLVEVAAERAKKLAAPDAARRSRPSFGARVRELFSAEGLTELGLEKNPLGRKVLFDRAREATLEKTHGNYPAAERILDVVRHGLDKGLRAGLEAEARAFGELVVSPEAKQLMTIFHATTALKKDKGTDEAGVEPRPVKKVGVLGGGLMGQGIAIVSAQQAGLQVRLRDKDHEAVGRALAKVRAELDGQLEKRRLTALERDRLMSKVTGTIDYSGFKNADVVIEAVFEDLELKRRVVREVEAVAGATTIFASNTSSLPIRKIAEASKHPETVLGMHYFSPVQKMPLLEIIVTDTTAPWATATCVELGKKQGKTVIVVRDGPGFYTTRILAPYMNEASRVVSEGVAIDSLDAALVKFGFPVGPVTLMDEVGIDVGEKVGHVLHDAFGERMAPVAGAERLIKDGRLGRKSNKGFYRYDVKKGEGERRPVDESVYELLGVAPTKQADEQTAWRCTLLMINEAARCFEEGILRSARDGDIGAIFGLGFPPFRGGPFRVVDTLGAAEVVARLERLRAQHGMRFEPCQLLKDMAKSGQTFHGEKKVAPRAWKPA